MLARLVIAALWFAWGVYWVVAGRDVKRTEWKESPVSRMLHLVPMLAGAVLMAVPAVLTTRFAPAGEILPLAGMPLVIGGLGLACWARRHLGRNWSAIVTVKIDHALIRTGPYRWVRHPIYSGLLLALAGTALALGEWRGIVALALILVAFIRKLWVEEARMRHTFPEYALYRKETAALIPLVF